jgi:hypothetical protein
MSAANIVLLAIPEENRFACPGAQFLLHLSKECPQIPPHNGVIDPVAKTWGGLTKEELYARFRMVWELAMSQAESNQKLFKPYIKNLAIELGVKPNSILRSDACFDAMLAKKIGLIGEVI